MFSFSVGWLVCQQDDILNGFLLNFDFDRFWPRTEPTNFKC